MASLRSILMGTAIVGSLGLAGQAQASLSVFQTYTGSYGISTSGCGSVSQSCNLTANVPTGSTVVGAYLYSSLFSATDVPGGTLNGSVVNYSTALGVNASNGYLQAWRADVTSTVAAAVGSGGSFVLPVTETQATQDGEGLVVVYSNPSIATTTIGILDGFSSSAGDASKITFSQPLTPNAPGFVAEMRIGDGFSYDGPDPNNPTNTGQTSTITVNGQVLTNVAGHCDDSQDPTCENGNLITVGADGDPYTPVDPTIGEDHERYDLTPFLNIGDTEIDLTTVNPSNDDNIFLEVFDVTGIAQINPPAVPEPMSLALLGVGLAGLGAVRRRARRKSA